jgi:ammonium transporter, Amt family
MILWAIHVIPGLRLRADEEDEILGIDDAQMGEYAYDYVGIDPELKPMHDYNQDIGVSGGAREPVHGSVDSSNHEKVYSPT